MLLSPKYFIYNIFPLLVILALPCYFFLGYQFSYLQEPRSFFYLSLGSGVFMSILLWQSMRKRYRHVMAFCYMICILVIVYSPLTLLTVDLIPLDKKEIKTYPVIDRYTTYSRRSRSTDYYVTILNDDHERMDFNVDVIIYELVTGPSKINMYRHPGLLDYSYLEMNTELALKSLGAPDSIMNGLR